MTRLVFLRPGAWFSTVLLLILPLALLSGCGSGPSGPAASQGAIGGRVLLAGVSDGSHGGIMVYVPGTSHQARTAADGAYVISGLAKGNYQVMADHPSANPQVVGEIAVNPDQHKQSSPATLPTIILEKRADAAPPTQVGAGQYGSIRGYAYLEGIESSEGIRIQVEGSRFVTAADPDGTYRFPLVDAGDYTLTYSRTGYETTSETVRVEAGKETQVGQVALLRQTADPMDALRVGSAPRQLVPTLTTEPLNRATLTGTKSIVGLVEVLDAEGKPVIDFTGITLGIDNTDYLEVPDERGAFRFSQLPSGVFKVIAGMPGSEPLTQLVDLTLDNTARITFRFEPPGRDTRTGEFVVTGIVVSPDADGLDQPVLGATVGIANTSLIVLTGEKGEFRLEKVPDGSSTLLVTKEGFEDLAAAVDLEQEGATEIDAGRLVLRPRVNEPRVTGTNPVEGEPNVTVGMVMPVVIRFNRAMDPDSLLSAVRVFPDSDIRLFLGAGRHPMSDDSTLVIEFQNADERRPIRFNSNYEILIDSAASDKEGTPMTEDFALRFRTGGFGVISTRPADKEVDSISGPSVPILIQFNTRIRPESVRNGTIQIRPRPDTAPQFVLSEDPATGWTTVQMLTRLKDEEEYTVTVGRGIRASTGQAITNAPYRFSFRTGINPNTSRKVRPRDR